MKTFIIINGKEVRIIERINMDKAIETAQNICDHSKEVIVREFNKITDHTKVYVNNPE